MNVIINQINYGLIKFYKKLMQEWLDNNKIYMYYMHSEGRSVIAERLIKTLKAQKNDLQRNDS